MQLEPVETNSIDDSRMYLISYFVSEMIINSSEFHLFISKKRYETID